ncbi:MAG: LCP family protein [Clostridia bacterium]|nr:LCP family protein [Clostridia bacterium]
MSKQNGKKIWLILICVTGTLVLFAALLLFARLSRKEETRVFVPSVAEDGTDSVQAKGKFNVLVAGSDEAAGLSDVLMLLSLDRDTGEVCVLQIPRDTYAAYTDGSYRKINGAANALGGMEPLRDLLSHAFGLEIHRYVRISADAFRKAVDALGGVEIELPFPMNYEDPAQGLYIHLPAGKQVLDGKAAEQFVRYRAGYVRGDLERMDAQKLFLGALFQKVKNSMNPLTAMKLVASLLSEVETDLSMGDFMTLAKEAFSISADQLSFVTAPGEDVIAPKSGASYYVLSARGMDRLLAERFGGREGGFDPDTLFLHENSQALRVIYEKDVPYVAYSVKDLGKTEDNQEITLDK